MPSRIETPRLRFTHEERRSAPTDSAQRRAARVGAEARQGATWSTTDAATSVFPSSA